MKNHKRFGYRTSSLKKGYTRKVCVSFKKSNEMLASIFCETVLPVYPRSTRITIQTPVILIITQKNATHRDSRYLHNELWTFFKEVHERKRLSDQVSPINSKRLSVLLFHRWESLSEETVCNTVTFTVNAIFRRYAFFAGGMPVEMSVFVVNNKKIPSRESVFTLVYCYIEKDPGQFQKVSVSLVFRLFVTDLSSD